MEIEKLLTKIRTEVFELISENASLKNTIDTLKNGVYKDKEIKSLEYDLKNANERSKHYGMRNKDYRRLLDWWDFHLNDAHTRELEADKRTFSKIKFSPDYKIEIEEYAECTCYSIVCKSCGKMENVYY